MGDSTTSSMSSHTDMLMTLQHRILSRLNSLEQRLVTVSNTIPNSHTHTFTTTQQQQAFTLLDHIQTLAATRINGNPSYSTAGVQPADADTPTHISTSTPTPTTTTESPQQTTTTPTRTTKNQRTPKLNNNASNPNGNSTRSAQKSRDPLPAITTSRTTPCTCDSMKLPIHEPSALECHLHSVCANTLRLTSYSFVRVASDYYEWSLEQRQQVLHAYSIHQLCKSIMMVNTKCTSPGPDNPQYILVLVQYTARLHNEKLIKYVASAISQNKYGKKQYNWRLAPEEVSNELSGYQHNAVTPIELVDKSMPYIVSHRIMEHCHIWLGGGEVDLKWRVNTRQLQQGFGSRVHVADITYDE